MLWSLEIIIFNILASQYQEIQPYSAIYIFCVKIKTSQIMKRECTICTNPWKKAIFETAESICRQFNLISRPASASLKMPWVVNWSLRPLCAHPNLAANSDSMWLQSLNWKFPANRSFPSAISRTEKQRRREWIPSLGFTLLPVYRSYSLFTVPPSPPPPPCPRSAPAFGQHLSIALDPKM